MTLIFLCRGGCMVWSCVCSKVLGNLCPTWQWLSL